MSANGSPQYAIVLMAVVAALLATIGVYTILLAFSVWLITAVAVSVNVAAIALRAREPDLDRPWRMPFFPLPAIFAMLVNLAFLAAFLFDTPDTALKATALAAVVAGVVYLATRRSPKPARTP